MATQAGTQWLSTEEQRAWRAYLESTKVLFDALDRQLQREAGMPHAYYEILVRLSEAPDRTMRMRDLAERCLSSRSRLSHAVARLEANGWVERRGTEGDRRGTVAVLTPDGFAALEKAAPGHVEAVRAHLFDQLSPAQITQLGRISRAIADSLREDRGA